MKQRSEVVVLGCRGAAGRMHVQIYQQLRVPVTGVDIADGPIDEMTSRDIPWSDIIVDICTPTSAHVQSIVWAYARGARRFIVEKPAASNLASWRALLPEIPSSLMFVTHPYLFSEGLRRALDLVPDIIEIDTVFDKDRGIDDARGRGGDMSGELPHVLQIEAPHQFALLQYISPSLSVSDVRFRCQGPRGASLVAPLDCTVTMSDSVVRRATLQTNLRADKKRTLTLASWSGSSLTIQFPTTAALVTRIECCNAGGQTKVIFAGKDDLLKSTLVNALRAMRSGSIPFEGSTRFASSVLARIDDAMAYLEHHMLASENNAWASRPVLPQNSVFNSVRDSGDSRIGLGA